MSRSFTTTGFGLPPNRPASAASRPGQQEGLNPGDRLTAEQRSRIQARLRRHYLAEDARQLSACSPAEESQLLRLRASLRRLLDRPNLTTAYKP